MNCNVTVDLIAHVFVILSLHPNSDWTFTSFAVFLSQSYRYLQKSHFLQGLAKQRPDTTFPMAEQSRMLPMLRYQGNTSGERLKNNPFPR